MKDKRQLAQLFSETSGDHQRQQLFIHHGRRLVGWAGLGPGDHVLDVAAGTGATLIPAAKRVGPTGRVVGLDIAPGMVAQLSRVIETERLANASALLGDAERLPFDSGSFDALICAFGLFFFADVAVALAEFRRVLRRGGRLAVATFTEAGSRSMDRTWALLGRFAQVPPPADKARRFDDQDRLREVLRGADFEEVELRVAPYRVVLSDTEAWWQWLRAMEFREYIDNLAPAAQADLRAGGRLEFGGGGPGSISFPMDALFARARRS